MNSSTSKKKKLFISKEDPSSLLVCAEESSSKRLKTADDRTVEFNHSVTVIETVDPPIFGNPLSTSCSSELLVTPKFPFRSSESLHPHVHVVPSLQTLNQQPSKETFHHNRTTVTFDSASQSNNSSAEELKDSSLQEKPNTDYCLSQKVDTNTHREGGFNRFKSIITNMIQKKRVRLVLSLIAVIASFLTLRSVNAWGGSAPVMNTKAAETKNTTANETAPVPVNASPNATVATTTDGAVVDKTASLTDANVTDLSSAESDESKAYFDFIEAVKANDFSLVESILLKNDTFVDRVDELGWLPIHEAASRGHVETVRVLLDVSKDRYINTRTGTDEDPGGSVLWWALDAGFSSEDPVVKLLVSRGAVNTPPDRLPEDEPEDEPEDDVPEDAIARFLEAARDNNVDTLQEVYDEHRGVIYASDENGWQAIHEAAQRGHYEAIQFLIDHDADIHARTGPDRDGPTALWWALDSGLDDEDPVIRALWEVGAVPLAEGSLVADFGPPFSTVDFTLADMHDAVVSEDCPALFDYATIRPAWLRVPDENGWLLLHEAARLGSIHCVTDILNILDYEEDFVNVRAGPAGGNALWLAKDALGEDDPMIELLESYGAVELEPLPDEL